MKYIKIVLVIMLSILSITSVEAVNKEVLLNKGQELYNQGVTAYKQGNYKSSSDYFHRSLAIREKNLGNKHAVTAISYNSLCVLYQDSGEYRRALKYCEKALATRKKVLGKGHIDTAMSYNNLGVIYKAMREYPKALNYYKKSLAIKEKVLGKEHAETAGSYNNLGVLYAAMGEYPKALKYHKKVLAIWEKVLGKGHINTAIIYSNIGAVYDSMGDYPKALEYHQKSSAIREKVLGKEHTDTASSYNNIGSLYSTMGDYPKALGYYQKALKIREKIFGEEHTDTASIYNSLGVLYEGMGEYPKALKYYQKASAILEKVLGKEHPETAINYNNLASIFYTIGDYSKALEYNQKSLAVKEKVFGEKHTSTAISYISMGVYCEKMGEYRKALEYYQKSLKIFEKTLGEEHALTAKSYSNLGRLYETMGDYANALKYQQKALYIRKKVLVKGHNDTAKSYNHLAGIFYTIGDYPKALEYSNMNLAINEKVLGKEHAETVLSYKNLGVLYGAMEDYPKAHHYAQLTFDIFLKNRDHVFTILDSKQKEKYLKSKSGYVVSLLNSSAKYLLQLTKEKKSAKAQVLLQSGANAWLNYKGSIFDSENAIAILYSSTKDKKLKAKIDALIISKRALAKLYQSFPKQKERETWKNNIKKTEEKIAKLTNEISSKATSFKEQQGLQSIEYKDITKQLKEDELYIDYAKAGSHYYLFSLDSKENITFTQINSKNTTKIDTIVETFRENVSVIMNDNTLSDKKLANLTHSSKEKLSKLYELIIQKPLGDTIENKTSLIISPDGALRLLPFEALYDKVNSKYFIEEKEIRYIPSGKELVRLYRYSKDKVAKVKKSAVIFANPNFDTKVASLNKEQIAITPNTNRSGIIKSLFRMRFDPLPGTKAEAKAIKATLKKDIVLEYQANKATESTLMKVKEPKILHIATHGFFINDNTIPNPMLKSGIALAGANASAIQGKSDGIVTALKLSGLDLKGTDLVVLSACQTGVVDINATDSVSGLSKAFIQAGAKDIVMSLWSVDDQATKELMTSFYQEMKENKNYAKALKSSKLKMIKEGRHPFYWAAFVVSGL